MRHHGEPAWSSTFTVAERRSALADSEATCGQRAAVLRRRGLVRAGVGAVGDAVAVGVRPPCGVVVVPGGQPSASVPLWSAHRSCVLGTPSLSRSGRTRHRAVAVAVALARVARRRAVVRRVGHAVAVDVACRRRRRSPSRFLSAWSALSTTDAVVVPVGDACRCRRRDRAPLGRAGERVVRAAVDGVGLAVAVGVGRAPPASARATATPALRRPSDTESANAVPLVDGGEQDVLELVGGEGGIHVEQRARPPRPRAARPSTCR